MRTKRLFPLLMLNETGATGGTPPAPTPPAPTPGPPAPAAPPAPVDLGFPADTALTEMTVEQVAAYWKNQSKLQQKRADAYTAFGDPAAISAALAAAETARVAAQAIEAARADGAATATQTTRDQWVNTAVEGHLVALTRSAGETFEAATTRVKGALEFADVSKFIDENGALDAAKVQTFAQSIGSKDSDGSAPQGDQLFVALQRQQAPAPGTPGSVDAIEQATYERLSTKK